MSTATGAEGLLETILTMASEKFEQIVSKLDKVSKTSTGIKARCPVHGSKGQTLGVSEKQGGYIVANCFSCGAKGIELVTALGLPTSLLFPDDGYVPPVITRDMKRKNIEDGLILQMSAQAKTLEETRTVNKSRERAKGYEAKLDEAEESVPTNHPALDPFKTIFNTALKKSPALRESIIESHWDGVAARAERWLKDQ